MTATEPQLATGDAPVPMPKTIGRFTILNEIGRGSYGVVWAAQDPVLAREVAIKVIPLAREAQFRTQIEANFLREAKSAGGMSHPSIVTIYDAGKTDAFAYIAMERLHGQDLHEYLAGGNRMSPRQAASMMMRLADAIHYANKRGLVHRDIKPSNIFLSRDLKPKLLDFGTALAPVPREARDSGTRQLVGTPNYMSPEQAKGEPLDARSDIFSLGTILYELLAGRRAFDGRTIDETLDQVIAARPRAVDKVRPETPAPLVAIVRKAMERDPAQRYQRASDFRNALADFVEGSRATLAEVSVAARPTEVPAPSAWSRTSTKALVGGVVVVAAALIVFVVLRPPPAPPPVAIEPVPVTPAPAPPPVEEPKAEVPAVEEPKPAETKAPRRRTEAASTAVPVRDGVVHLAVAPWGEVYVDGAARGVSPPLTQLTLPPGPHTIEVRNGSAPPFVVRIELRSGETISLQHRF
ncbi:MAG TPA: serine/threonine-protein kinase [Burkholderiaceae bacterium]|nr:serine/threonine-protein kinase [Burkholderiaceae bacterium]